MIEFYFVQIKKKYTYKIRYLLFYIDEKKNLQRIKIFVTPRTLYKTNWKCDNTKNRTKNEMEKYNTIFLVSCQIFAIRLQYVLCLRFDKNPVIEYRKKFKYHKPVSFTEICSIVN